MRYYLTIAILIVFSVFAGSFSALWAAPCNCQSNVAVSRPITVNRVVSTQPIIPTTHVVSRPFIGQTISNPIDIQIGQPSGQIFQSYETPIRSSASSSVATVVSDSYSPSITYTSLPKADTIVERRVISATPLESNLVVSQPTTIRKETFAAESVVSLEPLALLTSETPKAPKTESVAYSKPMELSVARPTELSAPAKSDSTKKNVDLRFTDDLKALTKRSIPPADLDKKIELERNLSSLESDVVLSLPKSPSSSKRMTLSKPDSEPTASPFLQVEQKMDSSKDVPFDPKKDILANKPPAKTVPPPSTLTRGQSTSISSSLQDVFSSPPPLPQGQVNPGVIPETLLEDSRPVTDDDVASILISDTKKPVIDKGKKETINSKAPFLAGEAKTNGTLLITTIMSIVLLIFMIVIAIDYYQRWLQSLTTLNNRFFLSNEDDIPSLYDEANTHYGEGFFSPSYFSNDYLEPSTRL